MGWITMNGTHIFIKDGESKDVAIKRFTAGKKTKTQTLKSPTTNENKTYNKIKKQYGKKKADEWAQFNKYAGDSKKKYTKATTKRNRRTTASVTSELDSNAGVRVDRRTYKKITRGKNKGMFENANGFAVHKDIVTKEILKTPKDKVKFYKTWK